MAFEDANIDGYLTHRKAAPLFDLFEQPFYILGIDPATTDLQIDSAFAAAQDGELVSKGSLVSAREAILSPTKRLSCELSYPLDSRSNEIAVLNEALRSNASASELILIANQLAPLSRANFLAHIASSQPANNALLYAIVMSHGAIDSTQVHTALKVFRTAAGWPAPSLLSVVQCLRELLDLHAEAVLGRYDNIEDAAEPVLACTQAILASDDRYNIEALARFLSVYRGSIEIKRSRAATLIKNASDALQQRPKEARLAGVLSNALEFWGSLCRPLILFDALHDHRDDDGLRGPAECVLMLVDDLTRSHHYTVAYQIAKLGRDLPGPAADPFDEQLRRIEQLASGGPIKRLRDLTGQLGAEPSSLISALEQSGFGPHSSEPAGRLREAFAQAAHSADRTDPTEPWTLLRDLAMRLARAGHHAAASALIRGLIQQGQADAAPRETVAMLPYDLSLIESQKRTQPAESCVLPPSEPGEDAVQPIQKLRKSPPPALERPGRQRRRHLLKGLFLAAAALAGAGFYFGFSQVPALWWQPVSNRPDLEGAAAPEVIPSVGTGQRYALPFVRYCHFQAERLKTIKQLTQGPEDTRAYNLLVVDYNARCSDFLYQSQDLVSVVAEVGANKSKIEADARRIISTWPGHATERK
jgi:hypothetical protein